MVTFRPHTAKVKIASASGYLQDTGEFAPPVESSLTFACRVSPVGGANKMIHKDGLRVDCRFLVHADANTPKLPYGALMEVYRQGQLIAKGSVTGWFSNQLNTRIWLS